MTYKERLMEDRPDLVKTGFVGGCFSCPGAYYKGAPISYTCGGGVHSKCDACWNSEMPESLYPRSVVKPADIDLNALVDKCIEAKTRLIKEGKFNTSDSARLINTMLRMYGHIGEVQE